MNKIYVNDGKLTYALTISRSMGWKRKKTKGSCRSERKKLENVDKNKKRG